MLGDKTKKLSDRDELLRGRNTTIDSTTYSYQVSGGEPAHTPQVAAQTCVDVATGQVYEWWAGAWH